MTERRDQLTGGDGLGDGRPAPESEREALREAAEQEALTEARRARDTAVAEQRMAASETDFLGPGTSGYTTSGAAYRGHEIAARTGAPSPADPGFGVSGKGLGYVAEEGETHDARS
jgi:hypothetical protein